MKQIRSVLLLGGSFSGAVGSLVSELRAQGYKVVHARPSLRRLRLRLIYVAAMFVESLLTNGLGFRRYVNRTRVSNWAHGLASLRTIEAHPDVDLVIQIGANHLPFVKRKPAGVVQTLYTDHTNLLSKQLPDLGLHIPERFVPALWNDLERRNLLLQDHVFVAGVHVKRSMVEDYGIPEERVTAVGAGPNLSVDAERDGVVKDRHSKQVLFVGLDAERKGLPALKRAFALVRRSHPDALLHVVGVSGVDEPGVIHHGRLKGDALKQKFYEARIFAMPSLREPFGFVFLEAMWSKAVCIGTNIGAIPEIIAEGRTGYLIEPNDAETLAARIVTLLDQPELAEQFADRAYAEAQRRRSWSHVVGQMIDTANRLLA